jgi:hypothetical protein
MIKQEACQTFAAKQVLINKELALPGQIELNPAGLILQKLKSLLLI